jgi:hypothetical protein
MTTTSLLEDDADLIKKASAELRELTHSLDDFVLEAPSSTSKTAKMAKIDAMLKCAKIPAKDRKGIMQRTTKFDGEIPWLTLGVELALKNAGLSQEEMIPMFAQRAKFYYRNQGMDTIRRGHTHEEVDYEFSRSSRKDSLCALAYYSM